MAAFGWSVGDCIQACILIKDVVTALSDTRGAASEYQELCRELWGLDRALLEVHQLAHNTKKSIELNALLHSVGRVATQCKCCIESFLEQIKSYQQTLRHGGSGNLLRDACGKIKWSVTQKHEVAKFRAEVNAYTSTINMLLVAASITMENIGKKVENTVTETAHKIETFLGQQLRILNEIYCKLELYGPKTPRQGEALATVESFVPEAQIFMTKMYKSTLENYNILLDIQQRIPRQAGPCWIQAPIIFTDPLGRVAPIHLELINTWEVFESVLAARFQNLRGQKKLQRREYALQNGCDAIEDLDRSRPFEACFIPGDNVIMFFSFKVYMLLSGCPKCRKNTEDTANRTTQCTQCGLFFQYIEEVDTSGDIPSKLTNMVSNEHKVQGKQKRSADTSLSYDEDEDVRLYQHIRLLLMPVTKLLGSSDQNSHATTQTESMLSYGRSQSPSSDHLLSEPPAFVRLSDVEHFSFKEFSYKDKMACFSFEKLLYEDENLSPEEILSSSWF